MGLLEDLKSEAERIRSEGERLTVAAQREAFYKANLRPKMLQALGYLDELLEQLKVVRPEVVGRYLLPGYSQPISATQALPKLTVDSGDNIQTLTLHMRYVATDLAFSVMSPTQADETRDFLLSGRYVFSDWPLREANGQLVGIRFSVAGLAIPASVTIYADIESGCLLFYSKNMGGFHDHRDVVRPEDMDAAWLDRLGHFLLGQGCSPAHLDIPPENREAIQQALKSEAAQREQELAQADRIVMEQQENERLGSRVKLLIGSVKERFSSRSRAE